MIKEAVILAAGMGTRLASSLSTYPKGFITLDQFPIIEESVKKLLKIGIEDIWIVTGYEPQYFERLAEKYPKNIHTVWNAEFEQSGTMHSLYCVKESLKGSFLLLESDIIYESRALEIITNHPADHCILLSDFSHSGDEVFVETKNNFLFNMSKNKSQLQNKPTGELVGITKISQRLFDYMTSYAEEKFEHTLFYDYETGALVDSSKEIDIDCFLVEDLIWAEIDDPDHLKRAIDLIYPMIKSNE